MNDGERIATLESLIGRVQSDMKNVWDNIERRSQNHTEIMSALAVIVSNQSSFKEYQKECNDDRKNYSDRLNGIENSQKTQKTVVVVLASVVSAVWAGVQFLFKH